MRWTVKDHKVRPSYPDALENTPRPLTRGQVIYAVAVTVFFFGTLFFGPW